MRKSILFFATGISLLFSACQKNSNEDVSALPDTTLSGVSKVDLLKDSVYLYSKEIYLWNNLIPTYDQFSPRQYSGGTELEGASGVMDAVRKLQPLDRFSFVTTKSASAGLQSGVDVDFGFFVKAASVDLVDPVDSVRWFVSYVYNQSAAGQAGVNRGWYVNKINNTTIGYDQSSIKILNDYFFGDATSATFEYIKPDGSAATANLAKTSFVSNAVLHTSVLNAGSKKVGYLVFNQFFGEASRTELNNAFSTFKTQGINELVVDLRYNPGGSTETQDALANLIAPASANNQVMYKYIFNTNLQQGNFPLLKRKPGYQNVSFAEDNNTQQFSNTGSLALSRVFVIVTGSSASASELLINNLKPYMDVKLIGDTTYGKPVGFFPVDVYDYSIYPISFKTVNSAGNADYYSGFAPDRLSPDGVNKNWGDATEPSLASALRYISSGSFGGRGIASPNNDRALKLQQMIEPTIRKWEGKKFNGMFSERF